MSDGVLLEVGYEYRFAGETVRKIKPGSGFYFENSMFHSLPLHHFKGTNQIPIASSRCQHSSDIVSGFYFVPFSVTVHFIVWLFCMALGDVGSLWHNETKKGGLRKSTVIAKVTGLVNLPVGIKVGDQQTARDQHRR